jgi:calcineurin-like phosphoesterase family protein
MKAVEKSLVLDTMEKGKSKTKSKKWDKYLADYKNYFKEYKKQYKSAQNGDQIALSQYPYMRAKWEALKKRMIKAKDNNSLNEIQVQKVDKINMKTVQLAFNEVG